MEPKEFWKWAGEKKLTGLIEKYSFYFEKIIKDCLAVSGEEVVLVSDLGFEDNLVAPIFAGCYLKAAKNKKIKLVMQEVKSKNQQADKKVIEALNELPEKSVIIICLSNLLGKLGYLGKSYRKFCRSRKHKFVSSTGLGSLYLDQIEDVMSSFDIDYKDLQSEGLRIKKFLDEAKEVLVKTKGGTDLKINIEGMKALVSAGVYNQPGLGGNVPTGEVYAPVKIRGANGRLAVDASVRHRDGTLLVKNPLILEIRDGKVVKIEGEGAELLEATLSEAEEKAKYPERVRMIGELGIGINPGAKVVGSTIIDEKVKGTAHIAIGSNYWYGGQIKTIIHLDQVFRNPKIFVDGKKLKV